MLFSYNLHRNVAIDFCFVYMRFLICIDDMSDSTLCCFPLFPTVMRIASISKAMTASFLATLLEEGILDLDADIRDFVDFPAKTWKEEEVRITTRMLVSHLGGIRHYEKAKVEKQEEAKAVGEKADEEKADEEKVDVKEKGSVEEKENAKNPRCIESDQNSSIMPHKLITKSPPAVSLNPSDTVEDTPPVQHYKKRPTPVKSEFAQEEYFIKDHFDSVTSSLSLFKDDPLVGEPGKSFSYTTHGWTLVSAVIEAAVLKAEERKEKTKDKTLATKSKPPPSPTFVKLMTGFFKRLDLRETRCEENDPLVPNRARHYRRNKFHKLENVPYVDNSYKWAGGGFLSTVKDLIKFGNANLYAFQYGGKAKIEGNESGSEMANERVGGITMDRTDNCLPGFVSRPVMKLLWTPVAYSMCPWAKEEPGNGYGIGWAVVPSADALGGPDFNNRSRTPTYVSHTGGAVGASSVLLIVPGDRGDGEEKTVSPHEGVVVAMICNLQEVGLYKTAVQIADLFLNT